MSAKTPSIISIDYSSKAPHRWPDLLNKAQKKPEAVVVSHILWGAHETAPGMRDFSRSSRLGLEKFLNLAGERGLSVELRIGFPAHPQAFPSWVFGLEQSALVPRMLWNPACDDFVLAEVPSLRNPSLRKGYLEFLEEVFSIVGLYTGRGGPVRRVVNDFGVYEADVSILAGREFVQRLQGRYPKVELLNKCYGTSFKDFGALESQQGVRLLFDRRPWVAAFDYRWCRAQELLSLWQEVWHLAARAQITKFLTSSLAVKPGSNSEKNSWGMAFDSVFIDSVGDTTFPLMPERMIQEASAQVFRFWEHLSARAKNDQIPLKLLPLWDAGMDFPYSVVVVVCGKYLTQASFECIGRFLDTGGNVFFPFGLPQYDEQMRTHDWSLRCQPIRASGDGSALLRLEAGEGAVWTASPSLETGGEIWEDLRRSVTWIAKEVSI